jgi:hypothetical protein
MLERRIFAWMEYTPPLGVGRYDAVFQVVSGGFVISSEARDMIVDECGYEDLTASITPPCVAGGATN